MFGQVQRTPFDIEFSLFGIPVRVHPLFWLISILFGWNPEMPQFMVIWVMCVFVSIVVHEMGHALMAEAFGFRCHVVLYHMGGYASYLPGRDYTAGKSMAISFAGPLAGFVLYGLIRLGTYVALEAGAEIPFMLGVALRMLEFINLYWGLVNLLPVLPLDGGRICEALLSLYRRIDGQMWTYRIGVFCGFAVAFYFLQMQYQYGAIMFGLLAILNLQQLSQTAR